VDLDVWFLFKDLFSSRHESKYGRPSSSRINYNIIGWDNKEKQKKKRLGWETDGIVALDPRDLGPANDSRAR
jgi:hypothetical protein